MIFGTSLGKAFFGFVTAAGLTLSMAGNSTAATFTYELNGSYSDSTGSGPDLTPYGGTLAGTGNAFGIAQGLSFDASGFGVLSQYYISITFMFDEADGYRKILDLQNTDTGLYNRSSFLDFYPTAGGGDASITNGATVTVGLTRDAAGTVTGSLNGTTQFSFLDTAGAAIIGPMPMRFSSTKATRG